MEIEYIGEHLTPGIIGNAFVVFAFVFALFSGISYFLGEKHEDESWKKMGRWFFRLHSISIAGIALSLFYIIFNHYFEYNYAYQHSSTDLPLRYMLSCFWEGQEGSFLLWLFWHAVIGNVLIRTARNWENSVMTVFAVVQVMLGSMLLGVYVLGIKIGSNPFLLLRENVDMMNIPLFQNPNYSSMIEGTGLNPLLQNYWMTIHPPTLFLGFASTLVPFSYAIASLWKKSYIEWLNPVLPWTFGGIMVLGTGVLMGGAWAYEALSFGGFWAWDPVENASLVPWLFLVAAGHLMLINRNKNEKPTSLITTYALTLLTFILILYSTYLTRSGILGKTSVHSFADGMPGQLILFLFLFIGLSVWMLFHRFREIPKSKEEEAFLSREFWMFIGSLVIVIAAFQITFTTSIPVVNAIFGTSLAPPINAIEHYNSWQIPFSIVVALMMALAQFLKYKKTTSESFLKNIWLSIVLSTLVTVLIAIALKMQNVILIVLLFASVLAVTSNTAFFFNVLKGKIKNAGASISHVGFALILLGALLSAGLQQNISVNTSGIDIRMKGEKSNANLDNILLYEKDTLPMGPYLVSYSGKQRSGVNMMYEVRYIEKSNGQVNEFSLYPRIQLNKMMGNVPEPDTKHFWNRDLFTYVSYVNQDDLTGEKKEDYQVLDTFILSKGDTGIVAPYLMVLKGVSRDVDYEKHKLSETDIAVKAILEIDNMHGVKSTLEPILVIRENRLYHIKDQDEDLGIRFSLTSIDPEAGKLNLIYEKDKNKKEDFIIMKAVIFPFINVLWIGCIIMIFGIVLAVYNRLSNQIKL